jgi:hypothetical protein
MDTDAYGRYKLLWEEAVAWTRGAAGKDTSLTSWRKTVGEPVCRP